MSESKGVNPRLVRSLTGLSQIEGIVQVLMRGRADSPRYFDCDGVPVSVGFVKAAGFDCAAWDVWPPRQFERDVALSSGREIDRPGFEALAIPILRTKYEEPLVPTRPDSIDLTPMPAEPAPLPTNTARRHRTGAGAFRQAWRCGSRCR